MPKRWQVEMNYWPELPAGGLPVELVPLELVSTEELLPELVALGLVAPPELVEDEELLLVNEELLP